MDIPVYTDIIFKGSNEDPLYLDFSKDYGEGIVDTKKITIYGEGGNRRLAIGTRNGSVKFNVDLHVYDGKHYAYIAPAEIDVYGNPDPKTLIYLINALGEYGKWDRCWWLYTKDQLNNLFKELVKVCR